MLRHTKLRIFRAGQANPLIRGYEHRGLLVLLTIYLTVTLTYGVLNPLGEGPDEVANIELIQFISEEGHLPLTYTDRQAAGYKSDWPMLLYHVPVGMATRWINYETLPSLKVLDNHYPRRLMVEDDFAHFALIHTDDEAFPYRGIVLLWHLARLVATISSAVSLVIIYFIVLAIRPDDPSLALGATAVAVAIPEFHFVGSVAHEDNVLAVFAGLFTLVLVRTWQHPKHYRLYAWLGLWFGLALSSKYSVGLQPLLVIVVLIGAVRRGELAWRAALGRLALFTATTGAVAIWWFVYVEWYFNQVKELGLVAGLLKPLMASGIDVSMRRVASLITRGTITAPILTAGLTAENSVTVWDFAIALFRPFWFIKWPADSHLMIALSLSFLALCILAVVGLWRARRRGEDWPWSTLGLLALQIGLLLPFPLLRFYLTHDLAMAAQGRHILIPAAAATGLLLSLGISGWFKPAYRDFARIGLAGILLVVSLVSFFGYVLPLFPRRLPVRTSDLAARDIPNRLDVSLAEGIELIGYEIHQANQHSALPVTLFWHSSGYVDEDYLAELSMIDESGKVLSLWLGHPINGHYPTRAWDPGDVIRDTVWLPMTDLKAASYRLRLRLRPALDLTESSPTVSTPSVFLTPYSLPMPLSPQLSSFVSPIIWYEGQPITGVPTYRYRATIPVTIPQTAISDLQSLASSPVSLVGPDGVGQTPDANAGNTYIFLVGADWPSGPYRLRTQGDSENIKSNTSLRVKVRGRTFQEPPLSYEVRANFGDEIMLLGYDFPQRRVEAGSALPITLYWQALRSPSRHYIVSNHLLNQIDLRQRGGMDRIPHYYYSTMLWARNEVVRDDYVVPVDASAPPGIYFLDIGLYAELAGQRWHLPLIRDGETLEANSVVISPIKVGGPPPGITVEDASPQHPRADNLGNLITLLGYDLHFDPGTLNLSLYWRCEDFLSSDYTRFVHVREINDGATGQSGMIVTQMDRPPADGAYPTSLWDPGEIIHDLVQVPIPPQMPRGKYEIIVGLYILQTGDRLPVLDGYGRPGGDYIRLDEEIVIP